jgi:dCTP deaminase
MILTKEEILKEIKVNRVKIEPFQKNSVGPATIDLTLSDKIRIFKYPDKTVKVEEKINFKKLTKLVDIKKGYILKPNELILGITKEKITLPDDICGWLNSRSRFARIGLMSHITAPFISPGISSYQVLEIFNAGHNNLKLVPGQRICHLILQKCLGKAKYTGKFKKQRLE